MDIAIVGGGARTLADCLSACRTAHGDPRHALKAYESKRLPIASEVVRTDRAHPPDFINIKVEELVGDRPFDDLDKYITHELAGAVGELQAGRRLLAGRRRRGVTKGCPPLLPMPLSIC
jgi:hypothetical protein